MHIEAMTRHGFVDERGRGLGGAFALARVVLHVLVRAALRGNLNENLGEGAVRGVVRGVVVVLRVPALHQVRRAMQSLARPSLSPIHDALVWTAVAGAAQGFVVIPRAHQKLRAAGTILGSERARWRALS